MSTSKCISRTGSWLKLFWNGTAIDIFQRQRIEAIEAGKPFPIFAETKLVTLEALGKQKTENVVGPTKFQFTNQKDNKELPKTTFGMSKESTSNNFFSFKPTEQKQTKFLDISEKAQPISDSFESKSKPSLSATFGFSFPSTSNVQANQNTLSKLQSNAPQKPSQSAPKTQPPVDERKFLYTLQAPAIYSTPQSQSTITHLQAGTFYSFQMERLNDPASLVVAFISLGFLNFSPIKKTELEQLKNWTIMNSGQSLFSIDYTKSSLHSNVLDIRQSSLNVLEVLWRADASEMPVTLALAVNCSGSDFPSVIDIDSEDSGAPFQLTVRTLQKSTCIQVDEACCLIKVQKAPIDNPQQASSYPFTILQSPTSTVSTRHLVSNSTPYTMYFTTDGERYRQMSEHKPTLEKLKNFLNKIPELNQHHYHPNPKPGNIYLVDSADEAPSEESRLATDEEVLQMFSLVGAPAFRCTQKDETVKSVNNQSVTLKHILLCPTWK